MLHNNTLKSTGRTAWLLLMALVMGCIVTACEKMVLDENDDDDTGAAQKGNVVLRASLYQIVPFDDTRAQRAIADVASRLSFVVYQDGVRKTLVNQKKGDDDYGQVAMTLQAGTYDLLVLAHSSPYGTPTLTDPSRIQFKNKDTGYSDTFCYYGPIEVTGDQQTVDLLLQRATSMVSITISDEIPPEVTNILVQYKGESGVLDATTGYGGTVNSEQYINFNVEGLKAPLTLRIYTFLRADEGMLKSVNIIATDASEQPVARKELTDVPMRHRMVTEYVGPLFTRQGALDFHLTAETAWEVFEQLPL